jgi:hypothetical protein
LDLVRLYHLPAHSLVRQSPVYPACHNMPGSNHCRPRTRTRPATSCRPRKAHKLFSSLLNTARILAALRLNLSVLVLQLACAAFDVLVVRRRGRLQRRQEMLVKLMASNIKQLARLPTLQLQLLYKPPARSIKPNKSVLKPRRTHSDPCSPSSDTSGCCFAS